MTCVRHGTYKYKLAAVILVAILVTLDNVSTWAALQHGAYELNPIVRPFTVNIIAYILFCTAKILLVTLIAYAYVRDLYTLTVIGAVMAYYAHAIHGNLINAGWLR